jgi:hypothetical protein
MHKFLNTRVKYMCTYSKTHGELSNASVCVCEYYNKHSDVVQVPGSLMPPTDPHQPGSVAASPSASHLSSLTHLERPACYYLVRLLSRNPFLVLVWNRNRFLSCCSCQMFRRADQPRLIVPENVKMLCLCLSV